MSITDAVAYVKAQRDCGCGWKADGLSVRPVVVSSDDIDQDDCDRG